jgi:hypothetical protein
MRRTLAPLALALAVCLLARAAHAQVPVPVSPGARVRVQTHDGDPQVGTVSRVSADTLYFRGERTGQVEPLHVLGLRHVEVSEGRPGRRGRVVTGAVVGIGAGAVMSNAFGRGCDTPLSPSHGGSCTGGRQTVSMALGVGALGALLGAFVPRRERWRTVLGSAPASIGLAPARRAICVSIGR